VKYLLVTSCNDMYLQEEDSPEEAVSEHIEHYDQHANEQFTVYELKEPVGTFGVGPRKVKRLK
jgi:hypothetical protein